MRNVLYATERTDKEAEPGYSREWISKDTPRQFIDNFEGIPSIDPNCNTQLEFFEKSCLKRPNAPFLGTRDCVGKDEKGKPKFGDYSWKSFKEVQLTA